MIYGGAAATAVLREGMAGSEFRCHSAAGGAKRTEIPLPIGPAKPIQITDYNRLVTPKECFLGAGKRFLPAGRERVLGGRWRSAVRGGKLPAAIAPPERNR